MTKAADNFRVATAVNCIEAWETLDRFVYVDWVEETDTYVIGEYFKMGGWANDPVNQSLVSLRDALALAEEYFHDLEMLKAEINIVGCEERTYIGGADHLANVLNDFFGNEIYDEGEVRGLAIGQHWQRVDGAYVVFFSRPQ